MKNKLFTILFIIGCFAVDAYAFVAQECKARDGWTAFQSPKSVETKLMSDLANKDISLGQPFSFQVAVCPKSKNTPDRIVANATMPAHKHGMNYTPTVTFDEETNLYSINDFLFHMPGVWKVSVSTYHGDIATHYVKIITVS
ncbi:hypothetical protein EOL70_11035 [Leucothrix sargassi]|nr:hypothetical protein EOL70_11035 [Leucothrix sargassi]